VTRDFERQPHFSFHDDEEILQLLTLWRQGDLISSRGPALRPECSAGLPIVFLGGLQHCGDGREGLRALGRPEAAADLPMAHSLAQLFSAGTSGWRRQ